LLTIAAARGCIVTTQRRRNARNRQRRTLGISREYPPSLVPAEAMLRRWPDYRRLRWSGLFARSQSTAGLCRQDHVAAKTIPVLRLRCTAAHTVTAAGRKMRYSANFDIGK